jgi:hypothetical protein
MLYVKMFGETPSEMLTLKLAQSARERAPPQCIGGGLSPVLGGHAERKPEPL